LMIDVQGLTKRFKDHVAVREISFTVGKGEVFGFLGPNGAGKSTTIKMLATLLRPSAGTAKVNGYDIVREPAKVRRSIGMVFQDPSLDDRLTARENLEMHGMLYALPKPVLRKRMNELLELVGLSERQNELVRTFSGGMKRRLELARGLLHAPGLLFLDEPTLGLDPQTRTHLWEYISGIQKTQGVTIFLTTHYMEEAEICHRIAIIDHGSLVALDTPQNLKRMVGQDLVLIRSQDPLAAKLKLESAFNLTTRQEEDVLVVDVPDGEEFVPRLAATIPGITAISVHRPTLEDVFLHLTGRAIREETAGGIDRMRAMRRARGRKS